MNIIYLSNKEDELLLNNPFVYEPLRLLNYNVDKINLTQEMIASAEFIFWYKNM